MPEFLKGRTRDRKLRLFAVACCRRIWHLMADEQSRIAVEVAERFADGMATEEELKLNRIAAEATHAAYAAGDLTWTSFAPIHATFAFSKREAAAGAAANCAAAKADISGDYVCNLAADAVDWLARASPEASSPRKGTEKQRQCDALRCVICNPLRPHAINPAWLAWNNGTVRRIAQSIYDNRAFDRMPILADPWRTVVATMRTS